MEDCVLGFLDMFRPPQAPPSEPQHMFRWKSRDQEFEARGLGLVVAFIAVVAVAATIVLGGTFANSALEAWKTDGVASQPRHTGGASNETSAR